MLKGTYKGFGACCHMTSISGTSLLRRCLPTFCVFYISMAPKSAGTGLACLKSRLDWNWMLSNWSCTSSKNRKGTFKTSTITSTILLSQMLTEWCNTVVNRTLSSRASNSKWVYIFKKMIKFIILNTEYLRGWNYRIVWHFFTRFAWKLKKHKKFLFFLLKLLLCQSTYQLIN